MDVIATESISLPLIFSKEEMNIHEEAVSMAEYPLPSISFRPRAIKQVQRSFFSSG